MTEEKKYLFTMSDIYRTYFLIREIDEGDDDIESDTDEMGDLLKPHEYHERVVPIANISIDMDELLDRIAAEYCEVCPNCGTTMDFVRKDEVACSLFSKKEKE